MKFKVGDYVKIKEGLNARNTNYFARDMEKYCGKIAKITKINSIGYSLDIDDGGWYWEEYMLEPLQEKIYSVIVVGNTVIVKDEKGKEGKAVCSPEDKFNLSTGISLAVEKLRWKPSNNEYYWTIDFSQPDYVYEYQWVNDCVDKRLFESGVVFKTEKEAKEVAKKMLEVM